MKKKIFAGILALAAVLALVCIIFAQGGSGTYLTAADEIALRIQFDTKEDVGLLVYDYRAEDRDYSGGISNADGSLLPGDSENMVVWNREELESTADALALWIRFRVITEYVTPNFENVYPADITKALEPIAWEARFGQTYTIAITGDRTNGYQAVFHP